MDYILKMYLVCIKFILNFYVIRSNLEKIYFSVNYRYYKIIFIVFIIYIMKM